MRLARHINAIQFGQAALVQSHQDDSPIGQRSRPAAFFFHGGVLYEALQLIPELRAQFGSHPHWDRSFGRFGTDEEIRRLYAQGTDLHRLRNHIGFHVLSIVPERSLPRLDLPSYVLARGQGTTVGKKYYELADNIALHYLLESPRTFSDLLAEFERRAAPISNLIVDLLEASDILIARVFESWGLRPERVINTSGTAAT